MSSFTARAIMDSFLKIAAKKPVTRITVRDIVEDCAINRNTFYYHFKDIYDVMDAVLMSGCDEDGAKDSEDRFGFFTKSLLSVLQFYFTRRDVIRNIYFSVGIERFSQPIKSYFSTTTRDFFLSIADNRKVASDDIDLLVCFYSNGLTGMLCDWVYDGMKQDPRYLAIRMHQLMQGCAKLAIENSIQNRFTNKYN